jgi:hypothetical protein
VQPGVIVVPQVIAPPVVAPCIHDYYGPTSGFSLTIGGKNGVFSISTAR